METYKLEKAIWSETDFDKMGWHDCIIWAMMTDADRVEYLVDLDYIFKWNDPEENEIGFSFWVAPVTMVFENMHQVKLDIESSQGTIEIADLYISESRITWNKSTNEYNYNFECQEGLISLWATGFKMFVRQYPVLIERQHLTLQERNGISFARINIEIV